MKTNNTFRWFCLWGLALVWPMFACAQDSYEPDNTAATAKWISNGVAQNRSIYGVGDVDLAKFVGPARNVRIVTSFDTQVWLIRGVTGAVVGYDEANGAGDDSVIEVPVLDPGTYYIKVREYGNDAAQTYQLLAWWESSQPDADAYEDDNASRYAKTVANGRSQSRTIHVRGDTDWAKFTVRGAGAANVRIETTGAAGDTQLWLYRTRDEGGAGARIAYNNDGAGMGGFSRVRRAFLPPDTYYIKVQESGNNSTIAFYTLRARWTNP